MVNDSKLKMTWRGAAHYHMKYRDVTFVIDPLYTRLPGDRPHLQASKETAGPMDYLLLTHGHLDHSWDFPYLLLKHDPTAFAPEKVIKRLQQSSHRKGIKFDFSRCRSLEDQNGKAFHISDLEITPYRIGTEEIDFWFIRSMCLRPLLHRKPAAVPTGMRWMCHHLFDNCFAYYFRMTKKQKTLLFFGNLTDRVEGMDHIDRVSVLAIPYCPANNKWKRQSAYLIKRFSPDVTLVHHFDNFMNPFTRSKYLELASYKEAVLAECPEAILFFSKFDEEIDFETIAAAGGSISAGRSDLEALSNIQSERFHD